MLFEKDRLKECIPDAAEATRYWEAEVLRWLHQTPQALWRRHSDQVWGSLIQEWRPADSGRVLKTDLFDEAVGIGVVPILSPIASELLGVDLAPSAAYAAMRRYEELNAVPGDVRALPYPDASIDTIISLSTLDHFDDRRDIATALGEFRRVLRPGGTLILTLDNPWNPLVGLRQILPNALLRGLGIVPYDCGVTVSPRRLRRMVREAGLIDVEMTAVLHCPRVFAVAAASVIERWAGDLQSGVARSFLSALLAFEALERWPTCYISGHFTALRVRAAAEGEATR